MHHDPSKKRRQAALRFFTYGVMTLAVLVISIICILFVLGYRFDQNSGKVEQRALLQLRSFPDNAAITIDDSLLSFRTPGKRTVSAGEHTVRLQLDGYREWSKTVTTHPGSLLWLSYARLVPNTVTNESIRSIEGSLTTLKASPDRRWLAYSTVVNKEPQLTIADISNADQPKFTTLAVPKEIQKLTGGEFDIEEWDFGGRYLLINHKVGKKQEFLQIDRTDPTAARNITHQLKVDLSEAHFAGSNGSVLFGLTTEGDIRKLDLGADTLSGPLVSDVNDFMLYKSDLIAYTGVANSHRVAGIYKDGSKEPVVVRTYPIKTKVQAVVSSYFNNNYLAIAHDGMVDIVKDPEHTADSAGRAYASFALKPGVGRLLFSSNGRFVVAQQNTAFASYDLEEDLAATSSIPQAGGISSKLRWLDDYYLVSDNGGTLRTVEFDGTNGQDITKVAPGYDATLSENGEYLFSISRSNKQWQLQRSLMVLN